MIFLVKCYTTSFNVHTRGMKNINENHQEIQIGGRKCIKKNKCCNEEIFHLCVYLRFLHVRPFLVRLVILILFIRIRSIA